MNALDQIKSLTRTLVRKKKPLIFGDLARTEPVSSTFGFDPGTPIDRYYIRAFLAAHRADISGSSLEVGEAKYLREFAERLTSAAILVPQSRLAKQPSEAERVVVADVACLETLPEAEFDCFVCTQTLNFIYDVRSAVFGAHRLLRGGGRFLGTVAGTCQVSRYDMERWGAYWRFTALGIEKLLAEAFSAGVRVESYGNALSAQMLLQGPAVEDLPDHSCWTSSIATIRSLWDFVR